MKTAVCAICRLENLYIREWVEYYRNLGFDNIILYDNNFEGEDDLIDVIGDYIASGFVIIDNTFKNARNFQVKAYNDCIEKHKDKYDWIAFFDCDEFLTLVHDKTINEYLSRFEDADEVVINWMLYDDNDLVHYDDRPVTERFTRKCPTICKYQNYRMPNFSDNWHVKPIAHFSRNKNMRFGMIPHFMVGKHNSVLNNGKNNPNLNSPFNKNINYDYAYVRHYIMKTIEEFINKKLRGFAPDLPDANFNKRYNIDVFFRLNKKTPEKEEIVKKMLNNKI